MRRGYKSPVQIVHIKGELMCVLLLVTRYANDAAANKFIASSREPINRLDIGTNRFIAMSGVQGEPVRQARKKNS